MTYSIPGLPSEKNQRLFVMYSSLALVVAGVLMVLLPVRFFPSFFDVRYTGLTSLLGALVIQTVPRIFFVDAARPDAIRKNHGARIMQFLLALIIVGNSASELGLYALYRYGFQYDKALHATVPFIAMVSLPLLLELRYGVAPSGSIPFVFFGVLCAGIAWEIYEYSIDFLLGTHLSGEFGHYVLPDTIFDVVWNTIGVVCGLIAVLYLCRKTQRSPVLKW